MKTKKEAMMSIKVRQHTVAGKVYNVYDVYMGVNYITKKPERLYGKSRADIEDKIDKFLAERNVSGDFATILTAEQIVDAKAAFARLHAANVFLPLSECARRFLEGTGATYSCTKSIGDCYEEFYSSKPDGADKNKTRNTTGVFVNKIGPDRQASTISGSEIESYLNSNYAKMSPVTYNSHFSYIFTFFNWCAHAKRKYIPENPMLALDKKVIAWKDPEYLKVEDVRKLFIALEQEKEKHNDLLAHAVTSFFTGTRREEIMRMAEMDGAAKVHLEDETIRIIKGKGYTRGRAPRTAHMMPNAIAWMRSFDYFNSLKLIDYQTTTKLFRFAENHGIHLFRNCGRHTFITMHVAAFGDPQKTQAMVGTSAKMRADHYDGLATKKEGEAYFSIYPSTSSRPDTNQGTPSEV